MQFLLYLCIGKGLKQKKTIAYMKKLLTFALAAMIMAGCAKQESKQETNMENQAILNIMTRSVLFSYMAHD